VGHGVSVATDFDADRVPIVYLAAKLMIA
jgi:hypothetical protein